MSKFIKVTPKGETSPRIVLASLKTFYIAQGAKIETPTDEEVYAVEPNERPADKQPAANADQAAEIARLQKEVAEAQQARADLQSQADQAQHTIAELREKLATTEAEVAEGERVINDLRKELAKTRKTTDTTKE